MKDEFLKRAINSCGCQGISRLVAEALSAACLCMSARRQVFELAALATRVIA
ncbi:MAG: hypothetical protein IT420_05370 [Candidatus Brocadia sp.]|nr:hypothetical protein [Candidatus Brocadia sp.]